MQWEYSDGFFWLPWINFGLLLAVIAIITVHFYRVHGWKCPGKRGSGRCSAPPPPPKPPRKSSGIEMTQLGSSKSSDKEQQVPLPVRKTLRSYLEILAEVKGQQAGGVSRTPTEGVALNDVISYEPME